MIPFLETAHCLTRAKCHLCRDPGRHGAQFREALRQVHAMPGPGLFDCPYGVTLKSLPPRQKMPPPPPPPENGLGTLAAKGIDLASLGLAKPVATIVAKIMGEPGCGCAARMECLNTLVPDVRKIPLLGWVLLVPQVLGCLTANKELTKGDLS